MTPRSILCELTRFSYVLLPSLVDARTRVKQGRAPGRKVVYPTECDDDEDDEVAKEE